jgi:hypothetical protein
MPVNPAENIEAGRGDFDLANLRGGLDDTSPYSALAHDACTKAENVEFFSSTLGERRKGCQAINLHISMLDPSLQVVSWMYRHTPTNDEGDAELWTLTQSLLGTEHLLMRRLISGWDQVSPEDPITVTEQRGHRLSAQTLHGKLFLAYKSSVNRLHVWDGSRLRRTGLVEPTVKPHVEDNGSGSLDATVRYYRIRFVVMDGTTVLRRSEPSPSVAFQPSGTGQYARVVRLYGIGEGETHWEIEASLDNANFYRIGRQALADINFDDDTDGALGYAIREGSVLSADIGDYTVLPSAKFLSADQDRLVMAGNWEDPDEASRVRWTPVFAAPGVGNDERMELDTDPFLDLDGYEGGEITGLSRAVNGYLFAFKRSHIYKLVRTGQRNKAYEAIPITKARGALPGSIVEATSQAGAPSIYFLDPAVGPTRMGAEGLQWCGRDIQTLWRRVNVNAKVPCHGVYYHDKRQLHYWIAVDGADFPNKKIVLHVSEVRNTDEGGRRGWVTVAKNNRIATAHCSVMAAINTNTLNVDRSFALVPFIGKERWSVGDSTIRDYIQQCDIGFKDAHTEGDENSEYRGIIISKPFALAGLLGQHGVMAGALLAKSFDDPDSYVYIKAIRDFGVEEKMVSSSLFTYNFETHVIRQLDDLNFRELYTLQIAMGDLDDNVTPPKAWELHRLQLKITRGLRA